MKNLFILDLFSGTGSVSSALKKKFGQKYKIHILTLDNLCKFDPTVCVNILNWNYRKDITTFLKDKRKEDIVIFHASPPCTEYSKAKTVAPRNLLKADKIVRKTLRILKFTNPDFWSIENPLGLLRHRSFMKKLAKYRQTCSYCMYGKPFRKNTDIWTNAPCKLHRCCSEKRCKFYKNGIHPRTAQAGTGVRQNARLKGYVKEKVYSLPSKLIRHIYKEAIP